MSASSLSNSGSPKPDRHAARDDVDARAAGVAGLAQRVHVGFERARSSRRWRRRTDCRRRAPSPRTGSRSRRSASCSRGTCVPYFCAQPFLRDRAGGHHRRRQAGRRTAAAARIAHAVLLPVGVVGVAGAERVARCCRSPCCAGRCCGSAARSACRWSCPRTRRTGSRPRRPRCAASRGAWCQGGGGPGRAGCRPRRAPCRAGSRRRRSRSPGRGFRRNW